MTRKRYASEPTYTNTPEFRAALNEWLDGKRGNTKELARQLGVDHTAITRLADGTTKKSAMIGAICRITGIPLPGGAGVAVDDPELAAAFATLKEADPEQYEAFRELWIRTAERLKGRKRD